ncbi:MAG: hypothetical protein K9J21_10770 [Bacteroidales bacterium]|nr:hypothetical protein [Bacteroidales bacterium]
MSNQFFEQPILNSPYDYPSRHWELDENGQPTQRINENRRRAEFITPIPKPRRRKESKQQTRIAFDEGKGEDNLLHLIVEIKGYRREDTKDKKAAIENYWIPGVNNTGSYGRWAFAEFRDVFDMEDEFSKKMEEEFNRIVEENALETAK